MTGPYFTGKSGGKTFYTSIATMIRERHPRLVGKHIFQQLLALGLYDEFRGGTTPYGLPYSFSDYEETTCAPGQ